MNGIVDSLAPVLAVVAMVVVPVVLVRAVFGGADLSRLYRAPSDGWPRGVQEEEPRPWGFGASRRTPERPGPATGDEVAVRPGPLERVRIGRPERSTP